MEDVLDLYAQPYDPQRPLICFDERPCLLRGEVREPLPAQPGKPQRFDSEYTREGSCSLFMNFAPQSGWRQVEVQERRTSQDFAQWMQRLVDEQFPEAEVIRVVLDNLNTHTPAALYQTFAPEEARRLTKKLEFHYTPKHGSWLNMVEIELSVLSRQCLNRRIPDRQTLQREVSAWEQRRNGQKATVKWQFTTEKARCKLQRLYLQ
ncbi:MAG: transposase [Candidatus Fraserbacteria bacterium RBG_16_55_9]|uniref:Transposase n=1 Tax=Fraserbacteria sp. (strain RBG_16_55_9) TaxID=1817864 RepID=A0A1F5UTA4_FRAXR|nr:MAG: transposase [Candidatus Fraserbacteria bacterium RBG_16_55_9]